MCCHRIGVKALERAITHVTHYLLLLLLPLMPVMFSSDGKAVVRATIQLSLTTCCCCCCCLIPLCADLYGKELVRAIIQVTHSPAVAAAAAAAAADLYGKELVRAIINVKWESFARAFLLMQVRLL
jgi:hypothetical protein